MFFSLCVLDSYAELSNDISLLESQAIEMINESKYDKAIIYLDKILEIDPQNINALNNKGGILIKSGNYSNAIDYFDEILKIDGNNTQALNNKAIALSKLQLYVQSLELFYKSLLTDPSNQNTFNNTKSLSEKLYWIDETPKSFGVVKVHDKNGNLVIYSKIHTIKVQPPLGYITLKNFGSLQEIEINGEKHKILFYNETVQFSTTQFVGRGDIHLTVGNNKFKVVELLLNGFIVTNTDRITYEFMILDPEF
mgnify:FL=1